MFSMDFSQSYLVFMSIEITSSFYGKREVITAVSNNYVNLTEFKGSIFSLRCLIYPSLLFNQVQNWNNISLTHLTSYQNLPRKK